ncbi:MAG: hypothetical protein IKG47_04630 [Oscillospiraceae bacterium]|nr:hypothetical protein [Oscillospiraceae bacterium]
MELKQNDKEELSLEKQKDLLLSVFSKEDIAFYSSILSNWATYNPEVPTVIQITTEAGTDGK